MSRHLSSCLPSLLLSMLALLSGCSSCQEEVYTPPPPRSSDMSMDLATADMQPDLSDAQLPSRIALSPEGPLTLEPGDTATLDYALFDQDDAPIAAQRIVSWSSSEEGVARLQVDQQARQVHIEAVSLGRSTLTAQIGQATASLEVEVTPRAITRIALSPDSLTLGEGETKLIMAQIFARNDFILRDRDLSWRSLDNTIATVDQNGLVIAAREGRTTIEASAEQVTASLELEVTSRPVATVTITTPTRPLLVHDTLTLMAVAKDSRGALLSNRPITWSVSPAEQATIDPTSGLLTAIAPGQVEVIAMADQAQDALTFTIAARPVSRIELSPRNYSLRVAEQLTMQAMVFDDLDNLLTDRPLTWHKTSGTTVLDVDQSGEVTALRAGAARVWVEAEGMFSNESILTVTLPVARVAITPTSLSLVIGQSASLQAQVFDDQDNVLVRQVIWQSMDPAIATVDPNGLVTTRAVGQTTLVATSEGVSDTIPIEVLPPPVDHVQISPRINTLAPGDTLQLSAVAFAADGSQLGNRAFTWSSSAPTIASVDATSGLVSGVALGRATITVTSEGKSDSALIVLPVRFESLSAGVSHTCGVTEQATLHCWGRNQYNVLASLTTQDQLLPAQVSFSPVITALSSLTLHQCVLTDMGKLYCWGANFAGQIGNGSPNLSVSAPAAIAPALTFSQVSAGGSHTCAITTAGALHCWGSNDYGQLGTHDRLAHDTPHALPDPIVFTRVSSGGSHTCAISNTGTLYCWGRNDKGQLGIANQPGDLTTPTPVDGAQTYVAVAAGPEHTCAITTAGATTCWGSNSDGQVGASPVGNQGATHQLVATGGATFSDIYAANTHSCGLTVTGEAYCWGANNNGQLGDGTTMGRVAATPVSGAITFAQLTLGASHSCGVSDDGVAYCWGSGSNGRLGTGNIQGSSLPVPITLP